MRTRATRRDTNARRISWTARRDQWPHQRRLLLFSVELLNVRLNHVDLNACRVGKREAGEEPSEVDVS